MVKGNEFIETLQKGVVDAAPAKSPLEERRQELLRAISEMEANVIKDPKSLETLRKELVAVEKELSEEMWKKSVELGDVAAKVEESEQKIDEKSEEDETKDQKQETNQKSEQEQVKTNEEQLKQAYRAAIVEYYDCRMNTLKHQRATGKLLSSDSDHKKEEELELAMYKARKAYIATGQEDPYQKFRETHDYIDRQAHEPFEKAIREKTSRYREIEHEIEKIEKEISEINEELDNKDLSQRERVERTERIAEIEAKKTNLNLEKSQYKDAEEIITIQRKRTSGSRMLQALRREAASDEQQKGYDYRRTQKQISQHNFDVAQQTEYKTIKTRIEERERRIKELTEKLEDTPDIDLEQRLNILESLNKETNMLEADKAQQEHLEKGHVMTETEMIQETYQQAQKAEEVEERFQKDTQEARMVVEQKDKLVGQMVVEQPSAGGYETHEREIKAKAAMAAAIVDSPTPGKDNIVQDYAQYKVAECVIRGVENEVRNPDVLEDAVAMVEHDEKLREADKQLDEVQKRIEDEIRG